MSGEASSTSSFEWDPYKEWLNILKHGVNFTTATEAFKDPRIRISIDSKHSEKEPRYFCLGKVGHRILTVRFLYRAGKIRIIGAGYWRKGAQCYDQDEKEKSS